MASRYVVAMVALALVSCEPGRGGVRISPVREPAAGRIEVRYVLVHPDSARLRLLVEFSSDGGATFEAATRAPGGDEQVELASSPSGVAHRYVWDSRLDLGDVRAGRVVLRLVPHDPLPGEAQTIGPFAVDNRNLVPDSGPIPYTNSGVRHARPAADAQVPVGGYPYYLEDLEIGTPLSDYGSHSGLKASVLDDGSVSARAFLSHAHYAAFQKASRQAGQARVWFEGPAGKVLDPARARSIEFRPWGWEERAAGDSIDAVGRVATLATDAFLVAAMVRNAGASPLALAPRLELFQDADPVHEGMFPFHLTGVPQWSSSLANDGRLRVAWETGIPAPIGFNHTFVHRTIRSGRAPASWTERQAGGPGATDWRGVLSGARETIPAGGSAEFVWVVGFGETSAEADARADAGWLELAGGAWPAWDARGREWRSFVAGIPAAHATKAEWRRVAETSISGLRMNRYAPRHAMRGENMTACKVHFNLFFVWDTAFAALGASEWSPDLAREVLREQLASQGASGVVCYARDDRHDPVNPILSGLSLAPASGWALRGVLARSSRIDPAWTREVYERSRDYVGWWERERRGGRTLFGFQNALETGWDDTPRYPRLHIGLLDLLGTSLGNLEGLAPTGDIDAVDLNVWMHEYYLALAELADRLALASEAAAWRAKATLLAKTLERDFWSAGHHAYFDRRHGASGAEHVTTLTPVMAWPLAMGLVRDPARARAVCEEHLLDPREFFGDPADPVQARYPVPSVAYCDPEYDFAQDGYYWRGQVWLIPVYFTLQALYRYGYEAEAETLRARVLDMIAAADPGGVHETYDAFTGEIGWGSGTGLGGFEEGSAFQLAFSCAMALEILLDRHQRERFLMPGERRISGYVAEVAELQGGTFYKVTAGGFEVPRSTLEAKAPDAIGATAAFTLRLEDPHRNAGSAPVAVTFPTLSAHEALAVAPDGSTRRIGTSQPGKGLRFQAELAGARVDHYRIAPKGR